MTTFFKRPTFLFTNLAIALIIFFGIALLAVNVDLSGIVTDILGASGAIEGQIGSAGSSVAAFAFPIVLGVAATFNPCGFAMLPAYLLIYFQDQEKNSNIGIGMLRALYVSSAMGLGVFTIFVPVGILLSLGTGAIGGFLSDQFAWAGLVIGGLLLLLGVYILRGGTLYSNLALATSGKLSSSNVSGVKGYYLYGLSFAVASLGCTLPLFIGLVSSSVVADGFVGTALTYVFYAMGMWATITLLTFAILFLKSAFARYLRKVLAYVTTISGVLVALVAVYLVLYWLIVGNLLGSFDFLKF